MQLHIDDKYRVVSIYTNCLPIILTIIQQILIGKHSQKAAQQIVLVFNINFQYFYLSAKLC